MTDNSDNKPTEQPNPDTVRDPQWDRKQGVPKERQVAKVVEKSSGRYSASEQSEQKRSKGKE
jgi:hypothetical protein